MPGWIDRLSDVVSRRLPLEGLVVAVTGAGHGAGKATANTLASQGARVAVGDLRYAYAERVASAINHTITPDGGGVAIALGLDVCDPESFRRFLEQAGNDFGPVDVLVNDPGGQAETGIEAMARSGSGHVVNIAAGPGAGDVLALTDLARSRSARAGVTFTAVVPRSGADADPEHVAEAVARAVRSRAETVRYPRRRLRRAFARSNGHSG